MKKNLVTFLTLLGVVMIAILFLILSIKDEIKIPDEAIYKEYQVKIGDTLWSIAEEFNTFEELTTRDYISVIKKINKLGTDKIEIGQVILIISNDLECLPSFIFEPTR